MNYKGYNFDYAVTHSGTFHADDVFAAALLRMINPRIVITRVNEVPKDFSGIIFDIGRGQFDHHQEDNELRENGVPYAAFGKLWRKFGHLVTSEENVEKIDRDFVQALDLTDNTGAPNPLSLLIDCSNPNWDSGLIDNFFDEAVDNAVSALYTLIEKYNSADRAKALVKEALDASEGPIVVLPKFAPWESILVPSEAKYVIFPSNRGGYMVQAVPVQEGSFELKQPLTKEHSVDGVNFIHNSGFIANCNTIESCKELAMLSMEKGEA